MHLSRDVFERARSAPDGVTRIEAEDGTAFIITRDVRTPSVIVIESESADVDAASIIVEPTAERPEGYPADLPFLPQLPCVVRIERERRFVVWVEDDSVAESIRREIKDLSREWPAAYTDAGDVPRTKEEVRALLDSLAANLEEEPPADPDAIADRLTRKLGIPRGPFARLREVMGRPVGPEAEARFDRAFSELLAGSAADGWGAEEGPEARPLHRAVLRKGDRSRVLHRFAMFGATQLILMDQDGSAD